MPGKAAIKKAHHFSGILLITFIVVHLLNHIMIFFSIEAHLEFMNVARKVYRHPVIEPILFASILFQVSSGCLLLWKKWRQADSIWDKLQIYSGIYFIYFLIAHPAAVLFGRQVWHLDTNLFFGAAVLNLNPLYYYFVFHYGLAIAAFFTHVACVHRIKMQAYTSQKNASTQSKIILAVGIVLAILIVSKMMDIPIPQEYLDGYSSVAK